MPGTDYSTYLRIDDLLALQCPLTEGADDEMLFIVVHQAYELWFKLVLHELGLARDRLVAGEPWLAAPRLRRAVAVEELLLHQLRILETMSPDGFLVFRDPLAPASGFQSTQFREIEIISGRLDDSHAASPLRSPEQQGALRRRAEETNLFEALCSSLGRFGYLAAHSEDEGAPEASDPDGADGVGSLSGAGGAGDTAVLDALARIYRDHEDATAASLHDVCELLVDHDEAVARWRHHHSLMAAREIGRRHGTGGSLGVRYLESTLDERFLPLLWEVRSVL